MKLFAGLSLVLFGLNSFPLSQQSTVTGQKAQALYNALDEALNEANLSEPPTPGMSIVSVDAVVCTLDITQQNQHCFVTAEEKTVEVSASAADLIAALTNAGATIIGTSETAQQISARQIHCSDSESPSGEQFNCGLVSQH